MPILPNESPQTIKQHLLHGMLSYMLAEFPTLEASAGYGYTQEHIDRCAAIVDAYLAKVTSDSKLTQHQICDAVRQAVLDLNALDDECGGCLIETDQREDLCALMLVAATKAGLDTEDDVTEEWRKW